MHLFPDTPVQFFAFAHELALRDADNNPLYTQKTLDGWVSDAEKKSKAQTNDPRADLR